MDNLKREKWFGFPEKWTFSLCLCGKQQQKCFPLQKCVNSFFVFEFSLHSSFESFEEYFECYIQLDVSFTNFSNAKMIL